MLEFRFRYSISFSPDNLSAMRTCFMSYLLVLVLVMVSRELVLVSVWVLTLLLLVLLQLVLTTTLTNSRRIINIESEARELNFVADSFHTMKLCVIVRRNCRSWQIWSSRDLSLGLETSRDPFLQVLVSVLVLEPQSLGLGLGMGTLESWSRSRSWNLRVLVLVLEPSSLGLGLGLGTAESWSWSWSWNPRVSVSVLVLGVGTVTRLKSCIHC